MMKYNQKITVALLLMLSIIRYKLMYVNINNISLLIVGLLLLSLNYNFFNNLMLEIKFIKYSNFVLFAVVFNYFILALLNSSAYFESMIFSKFILILSLSKLLFTLSILILSWYNTDKKRQYIIYGLLILAILNHIEILQDISIIVELIIYTLYILIMYYEKTKNGGEK